MQADGVFSGGGVKGIAFAGAIAAAEEAGYTEWVRLAGTSAGAIAAMALAVGYDASGMRQALEATDYSRIGESTNPIRRALNLVRRRGLTRGAGLSEWIEGLLREAPAPARLFGNSTGASRSSAATSHIPASSSFLTISCSMRTSVAILCARRSFRWPRRSGSAPATPTSSRR